MLLQKLEEISSPAPCFIWNLGWNISRLRPDGEKVSGGVGGWRWDRVRITFLGRCCWNPRWGWGLENGFSRRMWEKTGEIMSRQRGKGEIRKGFRQMKLLPFAYSSGSWGWLSQPGPSGSNCQVQILFLRRLIELKIKNGPALALGWGFIANVQKGNRYLLKDK